MAPRNDITSKGVADYVFASERVRIAVYTPEFLLSVLARCGAAVGGEEGIAAGVESLRDRYADLLAETFYAGVSVEPGEKRDEGAWFCPYVSIRRTCACGDELVRLGVFEKKPGVGPVQWYRPIRWKRDEDVAWPREVQAACKASSLSRIKAIIETARRRLRVKGW